MVFILFTIEIQRYIFNHNLNILLQFDWVESWEITHVLLGLLFLHSKGEVVVIVNIIFFKQLKKKKYNFSVTFSNNKRRVPGFCGGELVSSTHVAGYGDGHVGCPHCTLAHILWRFSSVLPQGLLFTGR